MGLKYEMSNSLVVQWVKDPVSSLQWLGLLQWHRFNPQNYKARFGRTQTVSLFHYTVLSPQTPTQVGCDDLRSQLNYHLIKSFPDHPIPNKPSYNEILLYHCFQISFTERVTKTGAL